MQLQDALGQFQVQLAADGRSEHTRKQYARHVRSLIAWLADADRSTEVADLSPGVLAEFMASDTATSSARGGRRKASSANTLRSSLRNFSRWVHDAGLAHENPARLLRRARCAAPPPRPLHVDEQERLLEVLRQATGPEAERDRLMIELMLATGLRIGSTVALDATDLDFQHGEIEVRSTKNDRPAMVVLPKAIGDRLRDWLGERTTGPVFQANGRRISVRHAQRRIAGYLAAAGIHGRSAHSLRHSFATDLLARTGDLRLVQTAMCHASVTSTTLYVQTERSQLREALCSSHRERPQPIC